jgi:hypothetical protein
LVGDPNSANLFRFTFTKTDIHAPTAPVDEASVKIVEAHQQRALAEAQKRALAEAHEASVALAEAQKLTEAEPQKLPEPVPLTDEEESQHWKALFIAENALKERMKLEQATKEALAIAEEKKLIDKLLELERIARRTPVAHVAHVARHTPVAQVPQVKPARTRNYNQLI